MQNVTNVPPQLFKQLFTRKALLILFLVWTAVILFQTWGIQHSCNPMFAWQNTDNNILKCSSIRKITVNPQKLDLKEGETHILTATVNGTGSFSSDVTWSSSSPKIATVDNRGLVTAVAEGKATITATSNQDSSKQDISSATIFPPEIKKVTPPKEGVKLITIIGGTAVTVGSVVVGVNAAPAFVAGTAAAFLIQWLSSK